MVKKVKDIEYPGELKEEIETYFDIKTEYLEKAPGKFLLIKGAMVVGVFESQKDAIKVGYEKFGNEPFLVKEVLEVEPELDFTANILRR